jgi:hypothetical protein
MGEHEISIKRIFDFRTSLPINEILYIQYINGKRKKVAMCRSNVIIYQNETKFEIYCNDKTESHNITEIFLKVATNTIT